MAIFTYNPDMTSSNCPVCGLIVPQYTNTPENPWKGSCRAGHTFIFQLESDDSSDLFETPELLPENLVSVIDRYTLEFESSIPLDACRALLLAIEPMGYTFDYGLEGTPYNLTQITH